jgi:hypothetical protein
MNECNGFDRGQEGPAISRGGSGMSCALIVVHGWVLDFECNGGLFICFPITGCIPDTKPAFWRDTNAVVAE